MKSRTLVIDVLGVTLALLVAMVLPGWVPVASADDCYLSPSGWTQCNVEATRSPAVNWPRGVSSNFPTVGGTVAISLINSVGVVADGSNFVESGWYLDAGRNRFNPFAVHVYYGLYSEDDAAAPAGNFTFQYEAKYIATYPTWWEIEALNNGSPWMDFTSAYPSFVTGYATTNAERHAAADAFGATPTFTNLQALSSTAWSYWPGALCFTDTDLQYQNNYYANPAKVTITQGAGNC